MMTFDEYQAVVEFIESRWPGLRETEGFLGFRANWGKERPEELVVTINVETGALDSIKTRLSCEEAEYVIIKGARRMLEVKVEESDAFRAFSKDLRPPGDAAIPVLPGDFAAVKGGAGYGTVGWNFFLNGALCALSNWHVFCFLDSETPPGTSVSFKGADRGEMIPDGYVRVLFGGAVNIWDYAVALYKDPSEAGDQMRMCANGVSLAYPREIAAATEGDRVYKVGEHRPVCDFGVVEGYTDQWVHYGGRRWAWFTGQVLVSRDMLGGRDSGSLLVRRSDEKAVGLNFAVKDGNGLANPIHQLGWQFLGMENGPGGTIFPSYRR